MTEDRCPISELPRAWCAHCLNKDLPEPAPLKLAPLTWFPARFAGHCAVCDRPITIGDDIAATDDGYICRRRHDDQ